MTFSSKFERMISLSKRSLAARKARRAKVAQEWRRRRIFEALEPRQMLDASSLLAVDANSLEQLPSEITIVDGNSYHYAFEGQYQDSVDTSTIEGLTESFPVGEQVSMTVVKTSTDGAVSTLGEVVLQLFGSEGEAPNSSAHFLSLVYDGYYEDLTIHRIMPDFVIQGGSSDGYGYEGSGVTIDAEYSDVLTHSGRGMVAFARKSTDINSSDAQFYICCDAQPYLDTVGYNVFAFVVSGYDVVDQLESASTTKNPISGEASFPVDQYTLTNVHVVDTADAESGVMRIVATDDASGVSVISFSTIDSEGAASLQQTMVYAGEDGLKSYVDDALEDVSFELIAGQSVSVDLPTQFGGYDVVYTIEDVTGTCGGYSIVSTDPNKASFTIETADTAGQYTTLIITATLSNGLSVQTSQEMFIAPSDPTYELVSSEDTKVAVLDEGSWIVDSDLASSELLLDVHIKTFNSSVSTTAPVSLFIDSVERDFTVVSTEYDEETEVLTYRLNLQLDEALALQDGEHTIGVQTYVAVDRITSHERLYSEIVSNDLTVDTQDLAFVPSELAFAILPGDSDELQLSVNKKDNLGFNRADVEFSLANAEAGPRFIALSKDGVLSWSNVTEEDAGVYYISVNAVDALGNEATQDITLTVSSAPVFEEISNEEARTGEKFSATVYAYVPGAEETPIKYQLLDNGYLASLGFTLNSDTGEIEWDVAANYLDASIQRQEIEFGVVATSQILQEDETYIDGESTTEYFVISVFNDVFDPEQSAAPEWDAIQSQSVKAGSRFELTVYASTPEGAEGVEYTMMATAPEGMFLNYKTGAMSWDVPEDYFGGSTTVRSETLAIVLYADTVWTSGVRSLDESNDLVMTTGALGDVLATGGYDIYGANEDGAYFVDYGDCGYATLYLTVENPNYVEKAPVFGELDVDTATTGETFVANFAATDPNGDADRILYNLVGEDYPEEFNLETISETDSAKVEWAIPKDRLDSKIQYETFQFTVRATKQYEQESGIYVDGESSEKTYTITIANSQYDEKKTEIPVWKTIDDQTVEAGEEFVLTVEATVESESADVEYSFSDDVPEDMTIDSETGEIKWSVPEDYFDGSTTIRSKTITISLLAQSVYSVDEAGAAYGGSAETEFDLTITNPDFVDSAPVFGELSVDTATTGETYSATFAATDPNEEADAIKYELVGTDYPEEFVLTTIEESDSAKITWAIGADYLDLDVSDATYRFTVKATEQFLLEDGTYEDGESSEKTYEITIANAKYDEKLAETPEWKEIAAPKVEAGEDFALTVEATVDDDYSVEYALDEDAPEGMTIDASTGEIKWSVPEDYFDGSTTIESKTITVSLVATTILESTDRQTDYSGEAETSFELTITNPDYISDVPVFDELDNPTTSTGTTYETTVVATDPQGLADRIVYELVGEDYPEEFAFDASTGKVTWTIAEDYLAENISAEIFSFTVKATSQYKQEGEKYVDGKSAEKTYEVMVANAKYDAEKGEAPVWKDVEAQKVKAGKTLSFTVEATVSEELEDVEYSLSGEYPKGMTIDEETGEVKWDVPEDYFDGSKTIESETITVDVKATAVVESSEHATDYSQDATKSVEITITNPNYISDITNWQEWFDAWVANAQAQYEGHAVNLADYLSSYLEAVDKRVADMTEATNEYNEGKTSLTEFIAKKNEIQSDFNNTVAEARAELTEADAKIDADYAQEVSRLNSAYDALSETDPAPIYIKEAAEKAAKKTVKETIEETTGSARFRMVNKDNGARVATTLTDVLNLWRNGYSTNRSSSQVFSDASFVEELEDEAEESKKEEETKVVEDSDDDSGNVAYTVDEDGNLVVA